VKMLDDWWWWGAESTQGAGQPGPRSSLLWTEIGEMSSIKTPDSEESNTIPM